MAEIQTQNNKQALINDYFKTVRKRDGRLVFFDQSFITRAIMKAMAVTGEGNEEDAIRVSDQTLIALRKKYSQDYILGIEEIQDIVEESLILLDYAKTVKSYILYRQKRAEIRVERKEVPERIKKIVEESKKYFQNPLGEFIYYRTYSRWIEEENRRETWIETIDRYVAFMKENLGEKLADVEYQEIKEAILNQKAMPSMRLLWGAGRAAKKNNICAYNCSFIAPTKINDFAEIMFLLMNGAGVGFSVEHQTTQLFPQIQKQVGKLLPTFVIEDSKEGWGDALTVGLTAWFEGEDINFDFSKIRPAGSHLKTMGGKASGPEPLKNLLVFSRRKILARQGRRLRPIDVHDIICKIGEVVVMGGVRRCLPYYTLVSTRDGLKPIKNIRSGDKVLTSKGKYQKVISSEYTGKKKLVNIHTQLGVFKSTPEHRWAVLADLDGGIKWVEAAKLSEIDALLHIPEVIPGNNTKLPEYKYFKPKYSTTTIDITIPALDEEIAWLIGYFHGDGYVYRKSDTYGEIMFACSPDMPETAEKLARILKRFGVNPGVISPKKNDGAIRVRVKSNQLANYFYQFKQPKISITIPDFILQGTPDIRSSYLIGVFDADGSIKSRNGKKVMPAISSIYPDWLRQLRALMASIGISVKISLNRPAKNNWKALYHLKPASIESLQNFTRTFSKISEKWENDAVGLERKKEQNTFIVPRQLLAASVYKNTFENSYYAQSSNISLSFSKFERETGIKHHYRPVKIYGVTFGEIEDTFDIQVEEDECFVAEGMLVHNSALISLSDLDDETMRAAKMGQFYLTEPQRSLANNSVAYDEKPTADQFLEEWLTLIKSGAGERGIFNRAGLKYQVPERRWKILEKEAATVGTNPCGEIYLKSKEFCNLTEVVARPEDTEESLLEKIRIAAILGTYQSTFTNFSYLSEEWKKNCEEERLLGISITGQWDCQILRNAEIFRKLKEKAIEINKIYAKRFNINPSAAITCVKPSGTVSQLVDASSGMHPRHSRYYIRRVRIAASDSLFQMLKEQRISYYPEVGQSMDSASTYVLEFPVKAPAGSIFRNDMSAIEQLEYWKLVKENYTEHNPSVTISVGRDEWVKVGNWVYENWDIVGGLSFLPREDEDHVYKLAPYEEIDEKKYNEMTAVFPEIDFSQIIAYEGEDETQGAKELACVSGVCEI